MKLFSVVAGGLVLVTGAAVTLDTNSAWGQGYDRTDPRNCPPRGDPRRTACLKRMVREGQVDIDRNKAYLDSLNQSMRKACAAAEAADAAARVAGRTQGPVRAVGRVWTSARALANFALGQRRECEKLRRELRRR